MNPFIKLFPNPSLVDVLAIFLTRPDEEFYQSYVVESTGYALIQVQRALKRLEIIGLIEKTKSGNRLYYKANQRHPAFQDIKNALFKTVLLGDLLKKSLESISKHIKFGFIYGSFASGKESASSDIDLFIVGELGIRDIANILSDSGRKLEREINPTVYSEKEFKKKIKEKNPFIKEVLNKPKIWLMGNESEFKKMDK
jgi:predicted nucleotidyltransferase